MNNPEAELSGYQNGIYFSSMQSIGELNPVLIKTIHQHSYFMNNLDSMKLLNNTQNLSLKNKAYAIDLPVNELRFLELCLSDLT